MFFVSNLIIRFILGIGLIQQSFIYLKPLVATLMMAMAVYAYRYISYGNIIIDLAFSIIIGVFVYLASIYLIWCLQGKKEGVETKVYRFIIEKFK